MATVKIRTTLQLLLVACFAGLLPHHLLGQDLLHLARQVTGGPSLHPSKYPQLAKQLREMEQQAAEQPDASETSVLESKGVYDYQEQSPFSAEQWAVLEMSQSPQPAHRQCTVDPSDPTSAICHVLFEWSWSSLSENQGDLLSFKINPIVPLEFCGQTFLLDIAAPVQSHADLTGRGGFSGLGDTRWKTSWVIPSRRRFLRSMAPTMEAIAPTGDEARGLGGGQWVWMPNTLFALQPSRNLSIYPTLRYLHADNLATDLVPELPSLPAATGGLFGTSDIRAFHTEIPFVFHLQNAGLDWVGVTPDLFQNLQSDGKSTFSMKYDAGIQLTNSCYCIMEAWHPVSSGTGNDFTFNVKLDWYPTRSRLRKRHLFRKFGSR
ncbi:MAG: hypothetical protein P8J33_17770 [Pirellulaceae bacterium]|nr:hypothetical protein [Pirellulaceae bacterium]